MSSRPWVVVGRILRTRGRVGEFIAEIDSSHPGRAERLHKVLLRKPPKEVEVEVSRLWYHSGRPILQFRGIDSIGAAEPWEGADILVPEAERVQPDPDEYFHADLIGCTVMDRGIAIGIVESVEEFGGPALLRLKNAQGTELLVPFAKSYLKEIDTAGKRISMELPEGLMDL